MRANWCSASHGTSGIASRIVMAMSAKLGPSARPLTKLAYCSPSVCCWRDGLKCIPNPKTSDSLSLHPRYCPDKPEIVKDEAGNEFTEWTFQVRVWLSSIG